MTYLDYSATTKINELALKEVTESLFEEAKKNDLDYYEKDIQKTLNTNHNIIFTSGSTESNNLAIKGVFENSSKKEIITTHLEHSSINETLKYLETKGAVIKYVSLKDGIVDLETLKNLIYSSRLSSSIFFNSLVILVSIFLLMTDTAFVCCSISLLIFNETSSVSTTPFIKL